MNNMEIRIRGAYGQLSNTEKKIADYFLGHMDTVFQMPIARLAEESGVSQVAWVRFCKQLGYRGLKDMKRSLYAELNEAVAENEKGAGYAFTDIRNYSDLGQIAENVKHCGMQAIEDTVRLLDREAMEAVVQRVIAAPTVQLFGVGASGQVAGDLYSKLIRIGKKAFFDRDLHVQLTYAANLSAGDAAVFFSNSGCTKEVLEVLAVARRSPAVCVSVTRYGKNPLAHSCDHRLFTSAPEVDRRSGAMSSRIAQLTLVDILFTAVANRDYSNVETVLEKSYEACQEHRVQS